nr:UvrD-helicase domain-containing protein [Kineosporia babensis]
MADSTGSTDGAGNSGTPVGRHVGSDAASSSEAAGAAPDSPQGATEREVAHEQDYLDQLYSRLDDIRSRAQKTLDEVRRASSSNTPAGRAEKDAFDALHTERLAQLDAVEDRLAFGRLDMSGGERRYVGRIGLSDEGQHQLLVDWRAPAAAAFYQATAASPGGVARRRHLATRGRTVTGIDDELLDAAGLDAADLTTVTGDGALMTALTEHRTGKMRDIVATLQSEQDQIVRAPLTGVLVVQGGPGTGKTAVALHRAAYLLYTHRERIAKSGVLVVGPSPVFLRYIERVLPSLGETGVVLSTPSQIFPGVEANATDVPNVAMLKGDLRMARVIREAVRQRQLLLPKPVPISLDGDQITLRPAAVAEARSRARQTGRPHNEARSTFVKHLLDDLAGQLARSRRLENDAETRLELAAELRDSIDVRREINLRWMPLSAEAFLDKLFSTPARLRAATEGKLAKAEARLLQRPAGSPWTQSDVPLLDEVAELIGPDVTATAEAARERARAAAERAEAVRYAQGVLQMSGEASAMMTADMLADRFEGPGGSLTVSERARDDRTWTYGHVVVDEAQEVSPMMWRTLARRVPSRSMTVVGDLAQTSSAAGASTWAGALDTIAKDRWRVSELTVNYRTPAKIMRPAAAMLTATGISVRLPESAREGDWEPSVLQTPAEPGAMAEAVLKAVTADEAALGGGQFAVILAREEVLGEVSERVRKSLLAPEYATLADRVSVLSVDDVKGLEYDAVTVVDPVGIIAASRRGASDLYVALTRPTQRLTVIHHGKLPKGL